MKSGYYPWDCVLLCKIVLYSGLLQCYCFPTCRRNSMGACAMGGKSARGGRGRGFYSEPVSYTSPPPRYIYQTSPTMATGSASPHFYQKTPTAAYFAVASPKRSGEEQMNVPALVEVAHPSTGMTIKMTKNSVQVMQVMVYNYPNTPLQLC